LRPLPLRQAERAESAHVYAVKMAVPARAGPPQTPPPACRAAAFFFGGRRFWKYSLEPFEQCPAVWYNSPIPRAGGRYAAARTPGKGRCPHDGKSAVYGGRRGRRGRAPGGGLYHDALAGVRLPPGGERQQRPGRPAT